MPEYVNIAALQADITAQITANGTKSITGPKLNKILKGMAEFLCSNCSGTIILTAPAALSLSPGSNNMTASCTAVAGATGYTFQLYSDAGYTTLISTLTSTTPTVSVNFTTLLPVTHYWAQVKATAAGLADSPYTRANATTAAATVPIKVYYWEGADGSQPATEGSWLTQPFITIGHNDDYTINFAAGGDPRRYAVAELASETVKTKVYLNAIDNFTMDAGQLFIGPGSTLGTLRPYYSDYDAIITDPAQFKK